MWKKTKLRVPVFAAPESSDSLWPLMDPSQQGLAEGLNSKSWSGAGKTSGAERKIASGDI